MNECGHDWEIEFSQHGNDNFLLVTQQIHGQFKNLGPEGEEKVLQDDLKDILIPGEEEDLAHKLFLKDFHR